MKSLKVTLGLLAVALCATFTSASAQVTLSGGADLVSSYVWRGAYTSAASVQPYAELGAGNFALGVWGSTATETTPSLSEVDFYLSYSVGNLSLMVTNYWWDGAAAPYFAGDHFYEASLSYTFGESFPLSVGVNTMIAGADSDYSTYITFDYPITVGEVGLDLGVGITPAAGAYADDFGVCSLSATASNSIAITDKFELPVFVSGIVNPTADTIFLLFGTSISF
ncbi:MAG: hypothetical protein SNH73_00175 [Rikenellaceae bacterium]